MDKIYESLNKFDISDYRHLFHRLLNEANQHIEMVSPEDKLFGEKLHRCIEGQVKAIVQAQLQVDQRQTTVHILFSLSDAGSLKVALDNRLENRVLAFNDMFAEGPIKDLHSIDGQQSREAWIRENDPYYLFSVQHNTANQIGAMMDTLQNIPESKKVIIWCADNAHDQTGLRFALYILREREQPVYVVNVSQVYREIGLERKGEFVPSASAHIERDTYVEIVRNYGEGRVLSYAERKTLETEWEELASEDHVLRLFKDGVIEGCEDDVLDQAIISSMVKLQRIQEDVHTFVKAGDLAMHILDSVRQSVTLSFLTNRIWKLVNDGVLVFQGKPGHLYQFSLRLI